jgi:hypothetical protein
MTQSTITTSGTLVNTNTNLTCNPGLFTVSNTLAGSSAIHVDYSGNTRLKNLILIDEVTEREWRVSVSDGQIKIIPLHPIDIRNQKIQDILE